MLLSKKCVNFQTTKIRKVFVTLNSWSKIKVKETFQSQIFFEDYYDVNVHLNMSLTLTLTSV